jgi:hypothetical protein
MEETFSLCILCTFILSVPSVHMQQIEMYCWYRKPTVQTLQWINPWIHGLVGKLLSYLNSVFYENNLCIVTVLKWLPLVTIMGQMSLVHTIYTIISLLNYIIILPFMSWSFRCPSSLKKKKYVHLSCLPHTLYTPPISLHLIWSSLLYLVDRLCGLVIRVPGYRFRGPGSIRAATKFSEKYWVWYGVH